MEPAASSDVPLTSYRRGRVAVHVNPDAADAVDVEAVFRLPDFLAGLDGGTSRQAGRVTWWRIEPDWSRGPLLVRRYAHGGALGPLLGDLFPSAARMVSELRVSAYAHRAGVPVPRPLAVRVEHVCGPLVRAYFVGELLTGALDLLAVCEAFEAGRHVPRRAVARSVGRAVARMHEAGIEHADLNLRNILVRRPFDEPAAHVIDFDCARVRGRLSTAQRAANLKRLDRSVRKRALSRATVGLLDRVCLLRSYAWECADPGPDWRALLRSVRL
jgi:tRNA A-37 threonylcarbamoyl transferase component Bud32